MQFFLGGSQFFERSLKSFGLFGSTEKNRKSLKRGMTSHHHLKHFPIRDHDPYIDDFRISRTFEKGVTLFDQSAHTGRLVPLARNHILRHKALDSPDLFAQFPHRFANHIAQFKMRDHRKQLRKKFLKLLLSIPDRRHLVLIKCLQCINLHRVLPSCFCVFDLQPPLPPALLFPHPARSGNRRPSDRVPLPARPAPQAAVAPVLRRRWGRSVPDDRLPFSTRSDPATQDLPQEDHDRRGAHGLRAALCEPATDLHASPVFVREGARSPQPVPEPSCASQLRDRPDNNSTFYPLSHSIDCSPHSFAEFFPFHAERITQNPATHKTPSFFSGFPDRMLRINLARTRRNSDRT